MNDARAQQRTLRCTVTVGGLCSPAVIAFVISSQLALGTLGGAAYRTERRCCSPRRSALGFIALGLQHSEGTTALQTWLEYVAIT